MPISVLADCTIRYVSPDSSLIPANSQLLLLDQLTEGGMLRFRRIAVWTAGLVVALKDEDHVGVIPAWPAPYSGIVGSAVHEDASAGLLMAETDLPCRGRWIPVNHKDHGRITPARPGLHDAVVIGVDV